MNVEEQINQHLSSLPAEKQSDMLTLHGLFRSWKPNYKTWYLSGTDEKGKVLTNPNIGYGIYQISYKNGTFRDFYRIGIAATQQGISVYFMNPEDRKLLTSKLKSDLGKATISGYCLKFKKLEEIKLDVFHSILKTID